MKITNKNLLKLLEKEKDFCDAKMLADIFGVSTKTISNYVKRINDYKKDLIFSSNKGYMLNTEIDIENEKHSLFFNDDAKSRINYIIKNLLVESGSITTYYLADSMYISDSHLETLLKQVKRTISKYDLSLARKRNILFLEGSETNKRRLLSSLLQKENDNFFETSNDFYFSNVPNLKSFVEQLSSTLKKHDAYINDYNFHTLIIYFCILAERVRANNTLEEDIASSYSIFSDNELFIDIKKITENFFNIHINEYEMHYLTLIIRNTCTMINNENITFENISKFVPQDIINNTLDALDKLEKYYHIPKFSKDFKVKILLHAMLMIDRIKSSNVQRNLMLNTIKVRYPFIYEISVHFVKELFKEDYIKVPDSEISFLAIHIGSHIDDEFSINDKLNCVFIHMNYYDYYTKQMNEIARKFDDSIQIVASFNAKFIDKLPKNVDFVITNYPFLKIKDLPVVYVGEILSKTSFVEIQCLIDDLLNKKNKETFKNSLKCFLNEKLFYHNIKVEGYENIINMMISDIEKLNLCNPEFRQEVLDREHLSSTAFDSSIAIPHSLYSNCNQSFIAIAINDEQVYWNEQKVNIVMLIGVKAGDENFYKIIIDNIIPFFYEYSNILKFLSVNNYDTFVDKLSSELFDKNII